jgi:hypothetical protein
MLEWCGGRYQDFTGEFVVHFHSVDHEDYGTMENVSVVSPTTAMIGSLQRFRFRKISSHWPANARRPERKGIGQGPMRFAKH